MEAKVTTYIRENLISILIVILLLVAIYRQSIIMEQVDDLDTRCFTIGENVEKIIRNMP